MNEKFRPFLTAILVLSLFLGIGFLAYPYVPSFSELPPHPETVIPAPYIQPIVPERSVQPFKAPLTQDGGPIFERFYLQESALIEDLYMTIHGLGLKKDRNELRDADIRFASQWYYNAVQWHEDYRDGYNSIITDSHPPVTIMSEGYYQKFLDLDVAFHDAIRELEGYKDQSSSEPADAEELDAWKVMLGYFDLLQEIHALLVELSAKYPDGFSLTDVAEADVLASFLEFRYQSFLEYMGQFKYMDKTQGIAMDQLQMAYQESIDELKRMGDKKTFILRREESRRAQIKTILQSHDPAVSLLINGVRDESALWAYADILIADIERRGELRYTEEEFNKLDGYLSAVIERIADIENERLFGETEIEDRLYGSDELMTDEDLELQD